MKEKYKDYVILIKSGNFYYTYLNDALILRYFFNYQIQGNRVGFPISIKNKVIKVLKDNNISIVEEENENIIMHKKINNNYYKELREAKESYKKARELDDLYKTIKYKVEECSYNYHLIKEYIDAL